MAVLSTVAYPGWLIPAEGVAEEQAPPEGSAGEMALAAVVISARVVAGSLPRMTSRPAAGPSARRAGDGGGSGPCPGSPPPRWGGAPHLAARVPRRGPQTA